MCFHEKVDKPEKELITDEKGDSGYNWKLPYRVSKIAYDRDQNDKICTRYDVVFNSDVQQYCYHDEFKKFVADTAIDGVSQVLSETKEKISRDYKIMKQLDCKGGEPGLMTMKVKTGNPLVDNMEIDNVKTRLEKEIEKSKRDAMTKEQREADDKKKAEDAAKREITGEVEDEEEEEPEVPEERPTKVI